MVSQITEGKKLAEPAIVSNYEDKTSFPFNIDYSGIRGENINAISTCWIHLS
jgi:hypothetical protein